MNRRNFVTLPVVALASNAAQSAQVVLPSGELGDGETFMVFLPVAGSDEFGVAVRTSVDADYCTVVVFYEVDVASYRFQDDVLMVGSDTNDTKTEATAPSEARGTLLLSQESFMPLAGSGVYAETRRNFRIPAARVRSVRLQLMKLVWEPAEIQVVSQEVGASG
jgi:hypothetical protein